MTDLWYYADVDETRGPLSNAELVPMLARLADPRRVMIWRHGFEDWHYGDSALNLWMQECVGLAIFNGVSVNADLAPRLEERAALIAAV